MNVNEKIYIIERDNKKYYGFITEVWSENEFHRAGFRADIHYPGKVIKNVEFKQDDIGKNVFYTK